MRNTFTDSDALGVTAVRMLAVDMVQKANSGHPGLPLGVSPMAYTLWRKFLRHNPANPNWPDRDRFVLSAGHGSAMLYALLHLFGYGLTLEDLREFRQWGSRTPGHPEFGHTAGVETTTGPLGQGFAMAVGLALGERFMAKEFNRPGHEIISHHTYVIAGDGDLMEGVSAEAASLAGHLGLEKLVCLYDDNGITIEGSTRLAFTEDTAGKFKAMNWRVIRVADGNDLTAVAGALAKARRPCGKPTLILVKTHIGYGSPHHDTAKVHGEPLGDGMAETRKFYNWPHAPFEIPDAVRAHFGQVKTELAGTEKSWARKLNAYRTAFPDDHDRLLKRFAGELPADLEAALPVFRPADGAVATRIALGKTLNALGEKLPALYGGSADLAPSNKTDLKNRQDHVIHFGIREHAMGAIINGLALHGGIVPFGATFFVFADYMRPAMRLAALMGCGSLFLFTHDGIGVGEDGPTHQAVEQLAGLRAMPGLLVFRPADANETAHSLALAIRLKKPAALAFTRQDLPVLDTEKLDIKAGVARGAYAVYGGQELPDVIVMATGSEVGIAVKACQELAAKGVKARAVSMPCLELFEEQDEAFRDALLPPRVRARIAVEAGSSLGWHKYTGDGGVVIALDRFGASAPWKVNFEKFGFSAANITATALKLLGK
ncbi:MAG: transketolase [Elusimicrobiaceae bacterium]|nr:transketolase [Elusimicrobiaceae bacterium]